jgi:hypothetical protein
MGKAGGWCGKEAVTVWGLGSGFVGRYIQSGIWRGIVICGGYG